MSAAVVPVTLPSLGLSLPQFMWALIAVMTVFVLSRYVFFVATVLLLALAIGLCFGVAVVNICMGAGPIG